jgi:hypothetical protein
MGKTRLALQLASREDMHVIYICCRPDTSSGYPPATDVIEPFIRANGLDGAVWPALFVAILTEYCEVPGILNDTAKRQQWLRGIVANDEEGKRFWRKVLDRYQVLRATWRPNVPLSLDLPPSAHFVFVFDEAASLATEQTVRSAVDGKTSTVSILNRVRTELRLTGRYHNVFGLFVDTNAHVHNLFPPSENHLLLTPSMREADLRRVQPDRVLPPFVMLPMCNPGTTPHMRSHRLRYHPLGPPDHDTDTGGGVVQVSYCPVTLALLSRPLFAMSVHQAFQQAVSFDRQTAILRETRDVAQSKLLAPGTTSLRDILNSDAISADTDVARLAVLGCRYGGVVASASSTDHKQRLLRQHLATCYGLSDDGKDLIVGYPSEPWLAEAAAELMLKTGALRVLLEALRRMVVRGSLALSTTGKGEMAALVVCLALSRAFDRACARLRSAAAAAVADTAAADPSGVCSTLCRPIPLVEVLVELYGGDANTDTDQAGPVRQKIVALLKDNALGHGIVMFNHFTKTDNAAVRDVASYKALLRRGAAVLCPSGETAARDIVIPVALPRDLDRAIDLWHSDSYVLTTWEIQVHHWRAAAACCVRDVVAQMVSTRTTQTVDRGFYASAQRRHMVDMDTTSGQRPPPTRRSTPPTPTRVIPVPILYSAFHTHADYRSTDKKQREMGAAWLVDQHWAMSMSATSTADTASTTTAGAVAAAAVETTETRSEGEEDEEEDDVEEEKEEKEEKAEERGGPQGKVPTTQKRGRRGSSPLHVSREVETRLDDDAEETLPGPKRQKTAAHSSTEDADDNIVGTAMDTTATAVTTAAAAQDETGTVAAGKTIKLQVTALQLCGLEAFSVFDEAERDAIQRLLVVADDVLAPLHQYHEKFLDVSPAEASRRVACLRPEYLR